MKSHSHIDKTDIEGTIKFISIVLSLWKIVSNKEIKGDERHKDPLKKSISSINEENLTFLKDVSVMAKKMHGKQGKRSKSLIRDTSLGLEH